MKSSKVQRCPVHFILTIHISAVSQQQFHNSLHSCNKEIWKIIDSLHELIVKYVWNDPCPQQNAMEFHRRYLCYSHRHRFSVGFPRLTFCLNSESKRRKSINSTHESMMICHLQLLDDFWITITSCFGQWCKTIFIFAVNLRFVLFYYEFHSFFQTLKKYLINRFSAQSECVLECIFKVNREKCHLCDCALVICQFSIFHIF